MIHVKEKKEFETKTAITTTTTTMNITGSLSPFVYWGQTSDSITLIIDLKNVKVCVFQFDYHHMDTIIFPFSSHR